MEQGLGPESSTPSSSRFIDKSKVLDVKPLRCLVPVFPSPPPGTSSGSGPQASSPFVCVPPTGPFPPGVAPVYPFLVSNESNRTGQANQHTPSSVPGSFSFGNAIPSPVPLNAFRTPTTQVGSQYSGSANGDTGRSRRGSRSRPVDSIGVDGDGYSDSMNDQYAGGFDDVEDGSTSGKRKGRSQKKARKGGLADSSPEFNEEAVVNSLVTSFKLADLDMFRKGSGDKDLLDRILLVYNLFRLRIAQFEESKESAPGTIRRPDLKAGNLLMKKGIRTNQTKRIGHVPGVEVGDIFFFRMELCIAGLHAPSMAGIDYISVKISADEEPVAVSIVSSGGYEDQQEDGDVLIYTGQGGVQRHDGLMFDQKLERGNLALEKSVHRGNEVRVMRGLKDILGSSGKIYVYDGLYKIQESWTEKNKSGCTIFKYKLVRVPGQPEAFTLWKSIQQWKDGVTSRGGVILPDLTSGAESLPVSLVNDVDDEKGPAYFTYFPSIKYTRPFPLPKPTLSCQCRGGCQPGDANCPCVQRNGGYLPFTSLGVLMSFNSVVHECGPTCACPPTCRNRITQAGLKVRLEVFKTKNRGWGLRSWDPIRVGGFICEYAGEVIDASKPGEFGGENEDSYIFDATRTYKPLEPAHDDSVGSSKAPFPLVITAKNGGNVARFMNHSCSPNVCWQPVLRETDSEAYLHIGFFAIKHIPPMQELTFDYGMLPADKAQYRKKKCLCGSLNCSGYFY